MCDMFQVCVSFALQGPLVRLLCIHYLVSAYNQGLLPQCLRGALPHWQHVKSLPPCSYPRIFPFVSVSLLKHPQLLPNPSLYSEHDSSSHHPWLKEKRKRSG